MKNQIRQELAKAFEILGRVKITCEDAENVALVKQAMRNAWVFLGEEKTPQFHEFDPTKTE